MAGMRSLNVVQAVLPAERIEVRTRRREGSCSAAVALSCRVEMNSMRSGREPRELNFNVYDPVHVLPQLDCTPSIARRILYRRVRNRYPVER